MELCCGALIGMGESDAQRVELLVQLQELDPTEVPLNFLNPRPGTPLGDEQPVAAWEAIRWIALFRLGLPGVILRYAGGREVTLRDLQAMGMTSGINALIVGNYLTTLGRSADEDLQMLADLRMPVGASDRRPLSRVAATSTATGVLHRLRIGRLIVRRVRSGTRPSPVLRPVRPAADGAGHPGRLPGPLPRPRRDERDVADRSTRRHRPPCRGTGLR